LDVVLLSVSLKREGGFVGFFCDILITDSALGEKSSFLATELDASLISHFLLSGSLVTDESLVI
jgi:hypothetical protein